MATPEEFAAACRAASRGLRKVPNDLRRELGQEVRTQVAEPLAARVRGAWSGPWARLLAGGTKVRTKADPTIVVGGARPRLSGGAGPRHIVYGVEFGSGKRLTAVPARSGRRGYRRYSTNQFHGRQAPALFPTVRANIPWVLDRFADIALDTLGKGVNTRG